jgi:Aerotolerance regulator N-terminal
MTFIHPLLLGGLVLAGIPVLVHLIMRQKPKHLMFPALRFLMLRQRANQRKLSLRHLLLLALRIALIALICLAMARPRVFSERFNINAERPMAVVLIFDTSDSMEYTVLGRSRLEEAKERSHELLEALPAGSRVAVLDTAEAGGEWLPNLNMARDRIDQLHLRAANYPVTAQLSPAYDLLAKLDQDPTAGDGPPLRFLYVFSDCTRPCWNAGQIESLARMRDRVPPPEVHAVFVDVGLPQPVDVAITDWHLSKDLLHAGERVTVSATVQATGGPCDTEMTCVLDGQTPGLRKPVQLAADSHAGIAFEFRDLKPGTHQVTLSLATSDAVPSNNSRFATFLVLEPRRVLILTDDVPGARIWELICEEGHAFTCDILSATPANVESLTTAKLAQYQAVCLLNVNGPTPNLWSKLNDFVRDGGGLAVIPGGAEVDISAYTSPEAMKLLPGKLVSVINSTGTLWSDEGLRHPIVSVFPAWKKSGNVDFYAGVPAAAYRYWEVTAPASAVIASYEDGARHPALLETVFDPARVHGHVVMFTTPFDKDHLSPGPTGKSQWTNYLQNSFGLVLGQRVMAYLAGDASSPHLDYSCGQVVTLPLPPSPRFPTYVLKGPGIATSGIPVKRSEHESQLTIRDASQPGNYEVTGADGKPTGGFSMNVDREESDLTQIPPSEIEALFGPGSVMRMTPKANLRDALQSRWSQPLELLPWLLMILVLVLTAETFLANRFYREEQPAA